MYVDINGKTQEEDQTRAFIQQEEKNEIESKAAHYFGERMRLKNSRGTGGNVALDAVIQLKQKSTCFGQNYSCDSRTHMF